MSGWTPIGLATTPGRRTSAGCQAAWLASVIRTDGALIDKVNPCADLLICSVGGTPRGSR
jgi:hypothetical protein